MEDIIDSMTKVSTFTPVATKTMCGKMVNLCTTLIVLMWPTERREQLEAHRSSKGIIVRMKAKRRNGGNIQPGSRLPSRKSKQSGSSRSIRSLLQYSIYYNGCSRSIPSPLHCKGCDLRQYMQRAIETDLYMYQK